MSSISKETTCDTMIIDIDMRQKHLKYLLKHLQQLPASHASQENQRLTILFFVLSALDLLDALDELSQEKKKEIIGWIYQQQLNPDSDNLKTGKFGFRTSPSNGPNSSYDYCNLAMTYCALASLVILGDDLTQVNRSAILKGLREHQKEDGSFVQALIENEDDMRIVYCASTICYMLNDWSTVDTNKMVEFIRSCWNYDGGFGQLPGTEAHGGPTFCAVASLFLMDQLEGVFTPDELNRIVYWCTRRQLCGFQGRPNKSEDSCYSFWIGATLCLLNSFQFVNIEKDQSFLETVQITRTGGFAKEIYCPSDPLHTYMAISALSLRNLLKTHSPDTILKPVFPALNISQRAYQHLMNIHEQWNCQG